MSALNIAASGMNSATVRMNASAHNVANLNTPSPRQLRTVQTSLPGGGSTAYARLEPTGRDVEFTREFVDQVRAKLQFGASIRAFSVASEMQGNLVDLLV